MFLNGELCKKCGGKCCKYYPGIALPKDFGNSRKEILNNLIRVFKSGLWTIDWIDRKKDLYFVRPSIKGYEDVLFDHSIQGECVFLTKNGCSLPIERRPTGCLLLEPIENGKCVPHISKAEASKEWKNYLDLLFDAAVEAQKINFEF
ncbi:MAG: hypothetical protein H0Z24_01475 [Thermosipho sp. (in: Bacteria)]|nr:hypothetical protein [Thermosipho sp. (in: thermotogales)]